MQFLKRFVPEFWDSEPDAGPKKSLINYRSTWRKAIIVLAIVSLVPLISLTIIDYDATRLAREAENKARLARIASNTRRAVTYFLDERMNALQYIAMRQDIPSMSSAERLGEILAVLKESFGGFSDLGLINSSGEQEAYVGPFKLEGRNYSDQEWFKQTLENGAYTSGVFRGFRDVPHLIVAVRSEDEITGERYVLRATLDTQQFFSILAATDLDGGGDLFIIDLHGVLQTPSRWHGVVLSKVGMPVPAPSENTEVFKVEDKDGDELNIGYAYITNTPFILMAVTRNEQVMQPWRLMMNQRLTMLFVNVVIILVVIVAVATRMVTKIYVADQNRAAALHKIEHTNRMASIGRLAAGVAHEINNPLAIINEKAGLVKDLFTYVEEYQKDERLLKNIEAILLSVERCGAITKRLLGFARHVEVHTQMIAFKNLAEEVLGFLDKEAEYRCIRITKDIPDDLPEFESDRGKIQQIFLNLVNNAFQAMQNGGHLKITAKESTEEDRLVFTVEDDGSGIPEKDLKRIFEPFFSTKTKKGGTGLGLSITHGLVVELGGSLSVTSEVGKGTAFTIKLPLHPENKDEKNTCEAPTE